MRPVGGKTAKEATAVGIPVLLSQLLQLGQARDSVLLAIRPFNVNAVAALERFERLLDILLLPGATQDVGRGKVAAIEGQAVEIGLGQTAMLLEDLLLGRASTNLKDSTHSLEPPETLSY
jgi:hypothetical protein